VLSVIGVDEQVPDLSGKTVRYINFDNAASTPPLQATMQTVNDFMPWYSSVHRGSGFKSQLSTHSYEQARDIVASFFGANKTDHVVIFGKNTTEAINKLSYRLDYSPDDVVLVSMLEHHSNDLPWRPRAQVEHITTDVLGQLDEDHFDKLLQLHKGRVKLVAVTGGSNVTGHIPNIHSLAKKAHAHGAQILVDCAQLAPHRVVDMKPLSDPSHLDYIAVSAHKLYAPFGTGALIGRRDTFESGEPDQRGGGTIKLVTTDEVEWASPPDCDEAGSPNVVGAIALAKSLRVLGGVGMKKIAKHEAELTAYALTHLNKINGVRVYGDTSPRSSSSRLGVIPFNVKDLPHALTAAILGAEWGIAVRSGCFCAHPYVTSLLDVSQAELAKFRSDVRNNNFSTMPGFVRVSFGLYNTTKEINRLTTALSAIATGEYRGRYKKDIKTGDYVVASWPPSFTSYFDLSQRS